MKFAVFLLSLLVSAASALRYNFGDGSYYVGSVDESGRPHGSGRFYNVEGELGKRSLEFVCTGENMHAKVS